MDVNGVAALVTGGGSGMGAATARALAAAGARVAVIDLDRSAAEAVAAETGGLALAADVADGAALEAAVAAARAAHGPARLAVACAGIAPAGLVVGRGGPHKLDLFQKVIGVNLAGTFNLLRLAAADLVRAEPLPGGERGAVVMTASIAAFEGQIGQAAYAASKGGVVALALPAARELARYGIRVVAIAPGLVATPMLLGMPQTVQDSLLETTVFPRRMARPEEYASLVLHIAANEMINGETIRMDGAVRMAAR